MSSCVGELLCPVGIADDLAQLTADEMNRWRVFVGHFHGYLGQCIEDRPVSFTLLPDPIARTRSHWYEVRRSPRHPHHRRVIEQTYEQFVQDDLNRVMIENYQARYLVRPLWDLRLLASRFTRYDFDHYTLSETLEQQSLRLSRPYLAELASDTLAEMAVVGTCNRVHEFLENVGRLLRLPPPSRNLTPRANATLHDEAGTLSPASHQRLLELTRIDRDLYTAAHARARIMATAV